MIRFVSSGPRTATHWTPVFFAGASLPPRKSASPIKSILCRGVFKYFLIWWMPYALSMPSFVTSIDVKPAARTSSRGSFLSNNRAIFNLSGVFSARHFSLSARPFFAETCHHFLSKRRECHLRPPILNDLAVRFSGRPVTDLKKNLTERFVDAADIPAVLISSCTLLSSRSDSDKRM